MKRLSVVLCALLLAAPMVSAATRDESVYQRMSSVIEWYYGASAAESKMYVGSEMCLSCHPNQAGWRDSMHATGFKATDTSAFSLQLKRGVIADYDQNGVDDFMEGLDFNQISSKFDAYKPNAPVLGYSDGTGYTVKVGEVTHPVKFAYGGSGVWKQRYMVKIATSEGESGRTLHEPRCNTTTWFTNTSRTIRRTGGTRTARRRSRHPAPAPTPRPRASRLTRAAPVVTSPVWPFGKTATGEYRAEAPPSTLYFPNDPHYYDFNGDRIKEHFNTGCERCHGPGSMHILERGNPEEIINPKTDLTAAQANEICGACHTRGKSVPNNLYGFPYDETTNTPAAAAIGEGLDGYYDPSPGQWPDKKNPTKHRQQYLEYLDSGHSGAGISCYTCHDVHNTEEHHNVTQIEYNGITVPTRVDNSPIPNTQCLACHAGNGDFADLTTQDVANYNDNLDKIAKSTTAHTYHPYAPERTAGLSRCTECHLTNVAKSAVAYDVSTHTFEAISPEKTLMYQDQGGMPSSCAARCHRGLSDPFGFTAGLESHDLE